ncbi:MAG TPA: hypothetical protein VIX90_15375, partial [Edaphobacter sp.]
PPPPDWSYQIRSRVYYDPDPATGLDRSLQNFIQALSYGQANIAGDLFPTVSSDTDEINIPAMNSLPAGHGYTHLLAVLPHSTGPNRGPFAFWNLPPVNGITAWARVGLYDDPNFIFRQLVGVWGMETLHMTTQYADLYKVNPNLGAFDVMADAFASVHASAHTKQSMGWLRNGTIVLIRGGASTINLQAIGLHQPPPPDRATAIEIRSNTGTSYFMAEARTRCDQYERGNGPNQGIPQEAVIVYEVFATTTVFLRATLTVGQHYSNPAEGIAITNKAAITGGFTVSVNKDVSAQCAVIKSDIADFQSDLKTEKDPIERRKILQAIAQLEAQARNLGCPK